MVVDGPEVEVCTEAREIARVGDRVDAFTAAGRKRELKGIGRKRAVDVEIAEENLLRPKDIEVGSRVRLSLVAQRDARGRQGPIGGLAALDRSPEPPAAWSR